MTREEVIKDLQSYADASWGGLNETFEIAISALREQESLEKKQATKTSDWISVDDRMPEKSGYYLYYAVNPYRDSQNGVGVSYFQHKVKEWKKVYTPCVTHWMPLPEPPKETK